MSEHKYDEIGPWSEIKLEILQQYSAEYSKILNNQPVIRRVVYIDGFAGAGEHLSEATGLMVPGSPKIALSLPQPFHEYHFVELNPHRTALLADLAGNRTNVFIHQGDCNETLIKTVFPRCRYEDYARGLCLLDPYKLAVDWNVLAVAGSMRTIEVFYNFMIMDFNMNMAKKNPEAVRPEQIVRMNAVWGDESWRSVAYIKPKGRLFDIEEKTSNEIVVDAFRSRLEKVAGFKYVPAPIAMRNSTGATVYYLFFASNNAVGAKIADHIFRAHRSD